MPELFQCLLLRVERWIEAIDRERDAHAQSMNWSRISDTERAFLQGRFIALDTERADAIDTLAVLRRMQHRPEVLFATRPRPRMLKARWRQPQDERQRA